MAGQDFALATLERYEVSTTVTFSNGFPIESVSKMNGNTDVKTIEQSAKISDQKVSHDMSFLRSKLENNEFNRGEKVWQVLNLIQAWD